MKIIGIGDLLIPDNYIEQGFNNFKNAGYDLKTVQWISDDYEHLQNINLMIEQNSAESYEVEDYVIDACKDADIVITQFCPINKKLIDNCNNLKAIGVLRGGIENINLDYCNEKDILVFNTHT